MKYTIKKAAVLGAGVMGAQIAAHLANVGIETCLLDIVPKDLTEDEKVKGLTLEHPEVRNRIVRNGLESTKNLRPAPFYSLKNAELINLGNFEDNMDWLKDADWIVEAVLENLNIKRIVFEKVEQYRKQGSIVSSNTSGIPLSDIVEGRSEDFKKHFLITHFFNPPRYLKLLEIVSGTATSPDVVNTMAEFCDKVLGKGIVYAKDTPNFIANRIGLFALNYGIKVMLEDDYKISEIDKMMGPAMGRPKSALFRTLDVVGIDTVVHVARNIYDNILADEKRDVFVMPDFINKMIENKWAGQKTGQGFYKKEKIGDKSEILELDYKTLEYKPQEKVKYASLETAKSIFDLPERIKFLAYAKDRAGLFIWKTLSETLLYSARRIPEIADDVVSIDNGMKWGFGWELGPFETWDAIDLETSVKRMEQEGKEIPEKIKKMLQTGKKSFYKQEDGYTYYYDFQTEDYKQLEEQEGFIILPSLKERKKVIKSNAGASLIDIGDGVACLEFHSKMNAIGSDTISMLNYSLQEVDKNYLGLVIGNQGQNFSVGANIMLILLEAQEGNWDELDLVVRQFQKATMAIKYSSKPVVTAPFGMTLGGGCEITLHGSRVQAAAETYIGLVEVGVGVIPAGGGTKEMLIRSIENAPKDGDIDLFPYVRRAFETIGMAKVATSAQEARQLGFLRTTDNISVNKERQIEDAKQTVLAMAKEGYSPSTPLTDIPVLGRAGSSALKLGIHMMKQGDYISEYDAVIGEKLAHILCGGDLNTPQKVSEQYILDLEREAFLSLCGQRKTLERIQNMLKTGKPLRN